MVIDILMLLLIRCTFESAENCVRQGSPSGDERKCRTTYMTRGAATADAVSRELYALELSKTSFLTNYLLRLHR